MVGFIASNATGIIPDSNRTSKLTDLLFTSRRYFANLVALLHVQIQNILYQGIYYL